MSGEKTKELVLKAISVVIVLLAGRMAPAQSKADENAIRRILDDEITAWNHGDADGYSRHVAADGTFTNVLGQFFDGWRWVRDRHEVIFKGPMGGTTLQQ